MDPNTLDGRTFEPRLGDAGSRRDPRRVFSEGDRERLAADPHLRPYLAITQSEVAGLLYALGRGAGVICPPEVGAEGLEASRDLEALYGELEYVDKPAPAPPHPDAVFDAAEQDELSYRKNVRGVERITREQLIRLLRAVDRFALTAPYVDVFPTGACVVISRWLHAHNVLVGFRDRPMSLEEFSEQVDFVMSEARRRERQPNLSENGSRRE